MKMPFAGMRQRGIRRMLEATYLDENDHVCTAHCRSDAIRRRAEMTVFRAGLPRY